MKLENAHIFVTGASRGIGRATAAALVGRGASVTVCSRNGEALAKLATEIGEDHCLAIAADLTDPGAVAAAVERSVERWGRLDGLVNSAGLARIAPVSDGDPDDWRAMWEINVLGVALCTRAALPHFPEDGGHVVNLSSLSGHRVPGTGGFYSATKYAVRAMTEALRIELRDRGSKTRVTALSPGFVDTELVDEYLSAGGKTRDDLGLEMIPADEVARTIVHVLTAPDCVEFNDVIFRPREQKV